MGVILQVALRPLVLGAGEKRAPCTRGVDKSRASGATTPAPRNRKVRTKQEAHAD